MNIQFYHARMHEGHHQEYTGAVNVPNKQELVDFVTKSLSGELNGCKLQVGVTKKHPKDQFCKATGRAMSTKQLNQVILRLDSVSLHEDGRQEITLLNANDDLIVTLEIRANRNRVYLTFVHKQ